MSFQQLKIRLSCRRNRRSKFILALGIYFLLHQMLLSQAALAAKTANNKEQDRGRGPKLSAKAVLVLDNNTGQTLLARNAHEVRSIASLTKLQAALVFMDRNLKIDEGTEISREDWKVALDGCRTRLELKWTYRNRDLLHAALMASDNRAISALGRAVSLNANGLVQAMNERARRKNLNNTKFTCPVGINPGNMSTAYEVAQIVREASKNKVLSQVMRKHDHQIKPMRGYLKTSYRNTNPLVGTQDDAIFTASKTGFNHKAGYCLASVANLRNAGNVTIVLLGSRTKPERVNDLRKVINWLNSSGKSAIASSSASSSSTN